MTNVLYFEGAGMDFYEEVTKNNSDVGNFRIRTSFFNNEGIQYYIEMGNGYRRDNKGKNTEEMNLRIDHLFKVEDRYKAELNGGGYEIKTDFIAIRELDYFKHDITKWINENLNCSFDTIEVLDSFYGYRVHGDNGTYSMMENVELNHERAIARKETYSNVDAEYRTLLNEKYSKIGLVEMDSESITIKCHASDRALGDLERTKQLVVNY